MIAIIDYGAGNLIRLNADGHETIVTSDPEVLLEAEAIVLPGVGNAGHAMEQLVHLGVPEAVGTAVAAEKSPLGICVGMQRCCLKTRKKALRKDWVCCLVEFARSKERNNGRIAPEAVSDIIGEQGGLKSLLLLCSLVRG